MRPDFALPDFPALACVLLLVSGSAGAQETASQPDRSWPKYATARGGKLRGLPDLAALAVRDLKVGEPLVVVGRQDQLYEVEVPGDGGVGLRRVRPRWQGNGDRRHDRGQRELRPEPRSDARAVPIARAKKGTHLVMLGREGDWIQVAAPAEIHGFVPGSDLEITNDPPLARAAEIAAAQKWVENLRAEAAQRTRRAAPTSNANKRKTPRRARR